MQTTRMRTLLAALCVLVLGCGMSWAADYSFYVDDARPDDSGDGLSWATAKKTIDGGILAAELWLDTNHGGDRDNMTPGDAMYIIVKAGTYSISSTIKPGSRRPSYENILGGSDSGAPLYIQSELWETTGKTSTILVCASGGQTIMEMDNYGPHGFKNWTVRGFTFRSDGAVTGADHFGINNKSSSGTVENNVFELVNDGGNRWYGIGAASNWIIRNNIIRKVGTTGGGNSPLCVSLGSSCEVYGNLMVMNGTGTSGTDGVIQLNQDSQNTTIHHNIMMGYPGTTVESCLYMPLYFITSNTQNIEVYANIIANAGRMVDAGNNTSTGNNTAFYNNTFYSGGYIHCYSDPDTFFNNLIVNEGGNNFSGSNGIYFDGFDHTVALGYDDHNDGVNYYRAPSTIFETTTLPVGWEDKLPSELATSGWLRPTIGSSYSGVSSLDGYNAATTDVYGESYFGAPQIGAVSPPVTDVYWDTDGATAGTPDSATSAWDTTTANWSSDASGSSATSAWLDSANAFFSAGSPSGTQTVNVTGSRSAGTLQIDDGTVILQSSGNLTVTGAVTVKPTASLVVNVPVSAATVTAESGGTLGGSGTITGTVTIQSGGSLSPGN